MISFPKYYVVIGASPGIGHEFARQLLLAHPQKIVFATYRSFETPQALYDLVKALKDPSKLRILKCDFTSEQTLKDLCKIPQLMGQIIEAVVINDGDMDWGTVIEGTSKSYYHHFQNNTLGPLLTAKYLLLIPSVQISNIAFNSDSYESSSIRYCIWGLAAYSASKAALNMGLRHLAVKVHRDLGSEAPVILALHTAETGADLGPNTAELTEAQIGVRGCLKIIREKGKYGIGEGGKSSAWAMGVIEDPEAATLWTWNVLRHLW
ncbi:hypothetical protein BOTNAR_0004g00130 [Botryotinia narcissicola]|uniref:Ketoreductase (KR) domain-containing protein n=1 Tax=Botryotinia narcissicola TaxID=278944 RepID=A0A4Z1J8V2_9HELO|nr:hypothetical protein BOTNAR_0004g00130 [Botryotinia narcissicola]